jgi:hypothetical protein
MKYGINEDEGMRLWKLKVKKKILNYKYTVMIFNSENAFSYSGNVQGE